MDGMVEICKPKIQVMFGWQFVIFYPNQSVSKAAKLFFFIQVLESYEIFPLVSLPSKERWIDR